MLRPGRAKALIGADSVPRLRRSIYLKLPGANLWSHLRCSIHPEPIPFLQTAAEEIRQPRAEIVPLRRRRFAVHTSLSYPGVTRPRTGRSAYATKEFFIADGGACGPSIIGAFGFEMRVMFFGKIANLRTRRPARSSFRLALSTPALAKLGCGPRGLTQDERGVGRSHCEGLAEARALRRGSSTGRSVSTSARKISATGGPDCATKILQHRSSQAGACGPCSTKWLKLPASGIAGRHILEVLRSSLVSLGISPTGSDARGTAQLRLTLASCPPLGSQGLGWLNDGGTES